MSVRIPKAGVTLALIIALAFVVLGTAARSRHGAAAGDTIFAVTNSELLSFDSATPGTVTTIGTLTGLQPSESIIAIDFRPATGQLYGIGTTGQLYIVDTTTAVVTPVGAPFALGAPAETSMDFNPTVDRIRVVSSADENFRLNPDTGAVAGTDINLAYDAADPNTGADPDVLAIGYTNNFAGASVTTLFGIDNTLDILVRQGGVDGVPSPNAGTLFTIGALGASSAFNRVGLDIGSGGTAFAYLEAGGGVPQLYTIDLGTGAATLVGNINSQFVIVDIAAQVVPATPTPSPSPTLSATPTAAATPASSSTPTPAQPAVLPPTGGDPRSGVGLLVIALVGALILASSGLGAWYTRRALR